MAEIKHSDAAIQDLEDIGDYIADTLKVPVAAANTVKRIRSKIDNLSDFPLLGTPLSYIIDTKLDFRYLVCGNYMVFYRYENGVVYISRILYGKRDYSKILPEEIIEGDNQPAKGENN